MAEELREVWAPVVHRRPEIAEVGADMFREHGADRGCAALPLPSRQDFLLAARKAEPTAPGPDGIGWVVEGSKGPDRFQEVF